MDREKWEGLLTFPETSDRVLLSRAVKILWGQRSDQKIHVQRINIVLERLLGEGEFTPSLFTQSDFKREASLNIAIDRITEKFGKQALYLGGAHHAMKAVTPKIAFNHIPDIESEA